MTFKWTPSVKEELSWTLIIFLFSLIILVLFLLISKKIVSHSTLQHDHFRYLIHKRRIISSRVSLFSSIWFFIQIFIQNGFEASRSILLLGTIVQPVFTEYLKSPIMVNFRIKFTMPITPNLSGYWKIG